MFILLMTTAISLFGMTLEQCIDLALKNNKALLSSVEDKEMADQLYYEARGSLLPQLSLQGAYNLSTTWLPESSKAPTADFSSELDDNATGNDSTLAGIMSYITNSMMPSDPMKEGSVVAQLKFSQILFSGGKLINGIHAVNKYRSIQGKRIDLLKQDLITNTTNMFYQTLLARKLWEVQEEGLALAKDHLKQVETFNGEGQVSEFDLLRAKLEVAKLQPDVVKAHNQYDLALSALKKQIGSVDPRFTVDDEFQIPNQPDIFSITNPDTLLIDLPAAQESAQKHRIELKLASINSEINTIKYKAEKGNYLPNLMLNADYSIYTAADEYAIQKNDYGTSFSVGVGFSIPLFTGLTNTAKRNYAKHEMWQAKIQERDASEMIQLEVKQAYQNMRTALENYKVQLENINLAERSLHLAQVRYENKVGIQLEVFDAQVMLSGVKLSYYNSIYEVISANQKLKKAMGYNL